jgi:hypothetical protein
MIVALVTLAVVAALWLVNRRRRSSREDALLRSLGEVDAHRAHWTDDGDQIHRKR